LTHDNVKIKRWPEKRKGQGTSVGSRFDWKKKGRTSWETKQGKQVTREGGKGWWKIGQTSPDKETKTKRPRTHCGKKENGAGKRVAMSAGEGRIALSGADGQTAMGKGSCDTKLEMEEGKKKGKRA